LKDLRITEGEIKADIATNITGTYTISLPGVNLWRYALPVIERERPKRVLIAFDSDKDGTATDYEDGEGKPVDVARNLAQLYLAVEKMGVPVAIETWKPEAGKGIDDVLVNAGEDVVEVMPEGDLHCPQCGGVMQLKSGRFGPFYSCTNFPKCRCSINLRGEAKKQAEIDMPPPQRAKPIPTDIRCDECGEPMWIRSGRSGKFLGCSKYPQCTFSKPLPPELADQGSSAKKG
jgi:ssDNA-binding Zn-finger/Zn-ribbon topoisomerase 1